MVCAQSKLFRCKCTQAAEHETCNLFLRRSSSIFLVIENTPPSAAGGIIGPVKMHEAGATQHGAGKDTRKQSWICTICLHLSTISDLEWHCVGG